MTSTNTSDVSSSTSFTSAIVNNSKTNNITDVPQSYDFTNTDFWYFYMESLFVGVICALGVIENIYVMKNSVKITRFAKQNVYLFVGLSVSDLLVCATRGPSLIYVLHNLGNPDAHHVCDLWTVSSLPVIIAILTNLVIAIERQMIMYSFQSYLKVFTPKTVLIVTCSIWGSVTAIGLGLFYILGFESVVNIKAKTCFVQTYTLDLSDEVGILLRFIYALLVAFIPVIVIALCYMAIIIKVCKAGLLKLDRFDEQANYTRVTSISFARVLLTFSCWVPYFIFIVVAPEYKESWLKHIRYFDYVCILQSVISPFVTMQDTDFKAMFSRRKFRSCGGYFQNKIMRRTSTKSSRRSNYITSADMRTVN